MLNSGDAGRVVTGLPDDGDPAGRREHRLGSTPHHLMVIDHDNPRPMGHRATPAAANATSEDIEPAAA